MYRATRRGASGTPLKLGKLDTSTTYAWPPLSTTSTPNRSIPSVAPQRRAISTSSGESEHGPPWLSEDRKSTRLNSSHSQISYAVFCLKKKKENPQASLDPKHTPPHLHHPSI